MVALSLPQRCAAIMMGVLGVEERHNQRARGYRVTPRCNSDSRTNGAMQMRIYSYALLIAWLSFYLFANISSASDLPSFPVDETLRHHPSVALLLGSPATRWNVTLRLAGTWNGKDAWTDTKLSTISNGDSASFLSLAALAKLNFTTIGQTGNITVNTTSTYFLVYNGNPNRLPVYQDLERMPDSICEAFSVAKGTQWKVLKGELRYTILKLKQRKLEATLRLGAGGLEVASGKTVDAKQTGTMTIYMAPTPTGGVAVRSVVSVGDWLTSTENAALRSGWVPYLPFLKAPVPTTIEGTAPLCFTLCSRTIFGD